MVCTSGGSFLHAVELLFSPSLFWALEFVLVLVGFSSSSSRFSNRRFILRRPVGRFCYRSCRRWNIFGLFVLANFDARSTLIHRLLRDTHHSDGSIGVF
jgi:hypothetical protein